jgi:hypothetical protein
MPKNNLSTLLFLSLATLISFLFSLSSFTYFSPQVIALLALITTACLFKKIPFILPVSALISLLVFITNGLNSPAFFLIYFLLFVIAFQHPPSITLSYSLLLIILLSQSLNSLNSLLPLLSLLLITPLAWFIGKQYLDNRKMADDLSIDETDTLFWHTLKFKTGITVIIDLVSQLLSTPLTTTQQEYGKKIQKSAKDLLKSSQKLVQKIDTQTDD